MSRLSETHSKPMIDKLFFAVLYYKDGYSWHIILFIVPPLPTMEPYIYLQAISYDLFWSFPIYSINDCVKSVQLTNEGHTLIIEANMKGKRQ